jgi:hypothetical protein
MHCVRASRRRRWPPTGPHASRRVAAQWSLRRLVNLSALRRSSEHEGQGGRFVDQIDRNRINLSGRCNRPPPPTLKAISSELQLRN